MLPHVLEDPTPVKLSSYYEAKSLGCGIRETRDRQTETERLETGSSSVLGRQETDRQTETETRDRDRRLETGSSSVLGRQETDRQTETETRDRDKRQGARAY